MMMTMVVVIVVVVDRLPGNCVWPDKAYDDDGNIISPGDLFTSLHILLCQGPNYYLSFSLCYTDTF